ncbi:PREDICTED: cationic peroxidase 2-like [Ipomoea nil]|uniref:cationic peroxidase 2-like n=1 Tax=Ipomoea nil TaxID=35883 RepID=UPI0009015588|nr:PREDICTED: cationic peroxidase 2-like [Ipomoea nil]XP_019169845.1 PREDICTED: cationic peroxidase 2-like [Ipomoea nil]
MEMGGLNKTAILFRVLLVVFGATLVLGQGTKVGFYATSCPTAESIVKATVKSHFQSDPKVAPGLLRMHFHDCFVQGCDASILIDGSDTEKTAVRNQGLRGYEVVDDAKKQLEAACPGVVSCADILALAARDSVVLTSGLTWLVPTGRRDGRVSSAADAANLPGFTDSVDVQKQKFSDKGLTTQDLVTLVGGHTIGTTACQFFSYRLYNTSSATIDPSIDPSFLATLQSLCPQGGDGTKRVSLDDGSETKFDTSFFSNLQKGHGILESDQKLWTDSSTKTFVQRFLGLRGLLGLTFSVEFGKSMVKMSNIGVKTGSDGEIRKVCSAFN